MEDSVLSRVTSEKEALDLNLSKLVEFLAKGNVEDIVGSTQARLLKRQKNAMENYSDVLGSRIADLQAAEAVIKEEFEVPESELVEHDEEKPVKKLTGQEAIDYIKGDLGIEPVIVDPKELK